LWIGLFDGDLAHRTTACIGQDAYVFEGLFRCLRGEPAHVTTIESRTRTLGLPA
jgi:hypothetical protein